jgi:DNA polymerase-3 subunit chi
MTEIDFYTHAPDRMQVAARLAAKAYAMGLNVRILTPDEATTTRLDNLLWTVPATGFVPHCRLSSKLAAQTPVIVDDAADHQGPADVLINLQDDKPAFFRRFTRLVEIVSDEPDDAAKGRLKWQFYKQQGYTLRAHDLARE